MQKHESILLLLTLLCLGFLSHAGYLSYKGNAGHCQGSQEDEDRGQDVLKIKVFTTTRVFHVLVLQNKHTFSKT